MTAPNCPSTMHTHTPPPQGGRCAFYAPGRPGNICGREPVALYINPQAPVRHTFRCRFHDRDVAVEAAAAQGFRRVALETKAQRIEAVERAVGRAA